jgi:hypothetical protein
MENLAAILSTATAAIGFLVTTVTFFTKFIKSERGKKIAEQIAKIGEAVLPYIKDAENFVNYSGAEKKAFVMTKANDFAIKNGIPFDAELVGAKIEELVGLTKSVNKRDKDATKEGSAV